MKRILLLALALLGCERELVPGPAAHRFVASNPGPADAGPTDAPDASSCGPCAPPEVCVAGRCATPPACAASGRRCGFEGASFCGTCGATTTCDASGRCRRPAGCEAVECGLDEASGRYCGACADGRACVEGRCLEAGAAACYAPPVELDGARPGQFKALTPFVEGATLAAIYMRDDPSPGDTGCSRFYGASVPALERPRLDARTPLPPSDFSDVSERECVRYEDVHCDGWVSGAQVRRDGLEMFYAASYPCGDWRDNELYLAWRRSVSEPWSRPQLLSALTTRTPLVEDGVNVGVLLGDERTLLYTRQGELQVFVARRASITPGDTAFVPIDSVPIDSFFRPTQPGARLEQIAFSGLGCDGESLLFSAHIEVRAGVFTIEPWAAAVLRFEPLVLAEARRIDIPPTNTRMRVAESPDCSAQYYWSEPRGYVRRRVRCP